MDTFVETPSAQPESLLVVFVRRPARTDVYDEFSSTYSSQPAAFKFSLISVVVLGFFTCENKEFTRYATSLKSLAVLNYFKVDFLL
jgi:hypothetical protein